MKKKLIIAPFIVALSLTSCGERQHPTEDYVMKLGYTEDFRILQLTDPHISDKDDQQLHYDFMDLTIKEAKANMIVVTGDLFTFASKETAKGFFKFLDGYGLPWTVVLGNHDEQCYFSVDWLTSYLNNFGSHCLFKDHQDDKVFGNSNFIINLMEGENIHDQLIFMDSNRYYYGSYLGYDYIKPNQIEWYKRVVNDTKTANGGNVANSLLFMHIPLPEIDPAYDEAIANNTIEFGVKKEPSCPPEHNSGFFDVIKEMGSTKAIFFGHDHINDFRLTYQGVTMAYGIKATDRVYFDESMLGGQVIIVKNDHSLDYNYYFHTYEELN